MLLYYSIDIKYSKTKIERKKNYLGHNRRKRIGKFFKNIKHLDLLINNAGIEFSPTQKDYLNLKSIECKLVGTFIMFCSKENG